MRSHLPRTFHRWPGWRVASLHTAKFAGLKTLQLVAGIALGFAALAVADTVTTSPDLHYLVAVGFVIIAGLMAWSGWVAHSRAGRRRRDLSNRRQVRDQSIRNLSRRFRRG